MKRIKLTEDQFNRLTKEGVIIQPDRNTLPKKYQLTIVDKLKNNKLESNKDILFKNLVELTNKIKSIKCKDSNPPLKEGVKIRPKCQPGQCTPEEVYEQYRQLSDNLQQTIEESKNLIDHIEKTKWC
jgi:RNase P subunit RPR2